MTLTDRIAEIEERAYAATTDNMDLLDRIPMIRSIARSDVPALCSALKVACEALARLEREEISGRGNEEGEDYLVCLRCEAQEWGSADVYESGEMEHRPDCPLAALASIERILAGGK
jgi:hypothetical protein